MTTFRRRDPGPMLLGVLIIVTSAAAFPAAGEAAEEPPADVELLGGPPLSKAESPWAAVDHSLRPTALWGDASTPLPTCAWWQNLVLGQGESLASVLPYQVKTKADGLHVCLPRKTVSPVAITTAFVSDLVLGAAEELGTRRVVGHDALSVTVAWSDSGKELTAPLVRGMPYATGLYDRFTPSIRTVHALVEVNGRGVAGGGSFSGTRFVLELNNGQRWILYASKKVSFTASIKGLTASRPLDGWLRVALAPDGADEVLDAHARRIPVGGTVRATARGDASQVTFEWKTKGRGELLAMTLPHHRDVLEGVAAAPLAVDTLRGTMRAVLGSEWTWTEPLTSIAWDPPRAIADEHREDVRAALRSEAGKRVTARDPYFGGKQVAALGRLALIADELGEDALASTYRDGIRRELDRWFDAGQKSCFVYDATWGGLIVRGGQESPSEWFGQGFYNDHHFHYGYFIYAAAVLARADETWREENREAVLHLVRDIANPSPADARYAPLRCMDWYVGHSWASGLFEFGDGRNQESTSEAVNAWYAVSLWGRAADDARVRDLGRLLLATEIRSSQRYWQPTSASDVYPRTFGDKKVVGILWSAKVDHATFFGNELEKVHCIQMLPFTPISEELLRGEWIAEEYPIVSRALSSSQDGWKGFIRMAQAILDPDAAWKAAQELSAFDDGNSRTNTLHWIATRARR